MSAIDAPVATSESPRESSGALRRWAIIAGLVGLTTLVFGVLLEASYVRLHAFLLVPLFAMALVPPRPLGFAHPAVRKAGWLVGPAVAVAAVLFSTLWDNSSEARVGEAHFIGNGQGVSHGARRLAQG